MERQLKKFLNQENRHSVMSEEDVAFARSLITKWMIEQGLPCKVRCTVDIADEWYMACEIEGARGKYDRYDKALMEWIESVENGSPPLFLRLGKGKSVWRWKFYHPECPDQFLALTDKIEQGKVEEGTSIEEVLKAAEDSQNTSFIVPKEKDGGNCAYVIVRKEFFDKIERGEKRSEYRDYNEYYVGKFLSHKISFIKLNLGYSGKSMTFAIDGLSYLDSEGREEVPCYKDNGELNLENDLPSGFMPRYFKISLGKRVR